MQFPDYKNINAVTTQQIITCLMSIIDLQPQACNFVEKEALTQLFSCELLRNF